jgi:hypothetical protein
MELSLNSVLFGTVLQLGAYNFGNGIQKLTEWTSYKPTVAAPVITKHIITTFTEFTPFTEFVTDTPSIPGTPTTITAPCASGTSPWSPETPGAVNPIWLKVSIILGLFSFLLFLSVTFLFANLVLHAADHQNGGNGPKPGEHNTPGLRERLRLGAKAFVAGILQTPAEPLHEGASPIIVPDDEVQHSEVAEAAAENDLAPPSAIESEEAFESAPIFEAQVSTLPSSPKDGATMAPPDVILEDLEIESNITQNAADIESSPDLAPPSVIESAEALKSTPTIEDQVNTSPSSPKDVAIPVIPTIVVEEPKIESDTAQNAADTESSPKSEAIIALQAEDRKDINVESPAVKDAAVSAPQQLAATLKPPTASKKKKYRSPSDIRARAETRGKWLESKKAEYGEQS